MAKIKNTDTTKILKGGRATLLVELKNGTTTSGKRLVVSNCPVIPPKRNENIYPQKIMRIFPTILAKNWKQPKRPSREQWINCSTFTVYTIHTKYYSAIKGGELLIRTVTWINSQNFMQSERSFADYMILEKAKLI